MNAINTTVQGLRTLSVTDINPATVYQTMDYGGGQWYYDGTDTSSLDNTGTILVNNNVTPQATFKRVYSGAVKAQWFAKYDGSDTVGLQKLFDWVPDNTTIDFGDGVCNFIQITLLSKSHIRITGNNTLLTGAIIIGTTAEINNSFEYYLRIDNIAFDLSANANPLPHAALTFGNAAMISISNVQFMNCTYSIYFPKVNSIDSINKQQCRRFTISTCHCKNVDYFVYIDNPNAAAPGSIVPGVGDIQIQNNNDIVVNVAHVMGYGVDGILIEGNTFFHSSWTGQSESKIQNIYLVASVWVHIHNNNLFEAGYESILLDLFNFVNISNNNIAWPGQRDVTNGYGIHLKGGGYQTTDYCSVIIADNLIELPTRSGILVGDASTDYLTNEVTITGNRIKSPGNPSHYYGTNGNLNAPTPSISSVSHYGIEYYLTNSGGLIANNICVNNDFNIPIDSAIPLSQRTRTFNNITVKGNFEAQESTITTVTSNTIDVSYQQLVTLNISGGASITTLNNGNLGQIVTLYNKNATQVSIVNSSSLVLKGSSDMILPNSASITLECRANGWYQIADTIQIVNKFGNPSQISDFHAIPNNFDLGYTYTSSPLNAPASRYFTYLKTSAANNNSYQQILAMSFNNAVYYTSENNGTWLNWERFAYNSHYTPLSGTTSYVPGYWNDLIEFTGTTVSNITIGYYNGTPVGQILIFKNSSTVNITVTPDNNNQTYQVTIAGQTGTPGKVTISPGAVLTLQASSPNTWVIAQNSSLYALNTAIPVNTSATVSGDGSSTVIQIPHFLGTTPSWYNAIPTSANAANISYLTADITNINIHYNVAPALGTNNLTYNLSYKV